LSLAGLWPFDGGGASNEPDAKVASARHDRNFDFFIGLLPVEWWPIQQVTDHRPRRSACELAALRSASGVVGRAGLREQIGALQPRGVARAMIAAQSAARASAPKL
jgi:hypothetical protein